MVRTVHQPHFLSSAHSQRRRYSQQQVVRKKTIPVLLATKTIPMKCASKTFIHLFLSLSSPLPLLLSPLPSSPSSLPSPPLLSSLPVSSSPPLRYGYWHGSTEDGETSEHDCLSWSSSSYTSTGRASVSTDSNNVFLDQIDIRCDRPLAVLCVLSTTEL